ncbi:MAG: Kdo hydroxylase family protein [Gammaproteobacteria bacterium]|nr:Kdo hydroxylase family protein [Gammaproteobacteria bacterium]MDH5212829.1 Kdo hydroxylase family protein [Gammaproteobacteria bacterium]
MLQTFDQSRLAGAGPNDLSDALEEGAIVFFPSSPVPLPSPDDLEFFRVELPKLLKLKNISYHPEAGHVRGLGDADAATAQRITRVLTGVSGEIERFLKAKAPGLTKDWTVGTCSFRPIQEKGRNLKPHASNELVHVDAGAYGATNGDRILRFFINVNPTEDRVWASKGTFPAVYQRYGKAAGIAVANPGTNYLRKGPLDHLRTGLLKGVAALGLPAAHVLDSSPYDRVMRRFHNFMKDTPAFQQDTEGHVEFRFPPFSAWMVFTDMVSHASLSGQHAFVHTSIVRLASCRKPELAPYNILRQSAA